jgi:hypothetical protein
MMYAVAVGASTGNPIAAVIGGAIDILGALFGFGVFGGGGQADLSSVARTPVVLQPSPEVDGQFGSAQAPESADSPGSYDSGSLWNEKLPIRRPLVGIFGGGSLATMLGINMPSPWMLDANPIDPNSIKLHHVFPQAFRMWFLEQGIDIDQYLISLPAGVHRLAEFGGIHTGVNNWNAAWKVFKAESPKATKEQMFDFATLLSKTASAVR